jgi:DNA-directed RNA polymerase alpha subunit
MMENLSAELPNDTPLEKVRLPTRIFNALSRAGVRTLGEIRESTDKTLASLPDLGRVSVKWLRDRL